MRGRLSCLLRRLVRDESGATAIEYGLIAGMIACAIITVVRHVGSNLTNKFNQIANNLT